MTRISSSLWLVVPLLVSCVKDEWTVVRNSGATIAGSIELEGQTTDGDWEGVASRRSAKMLCVGPVKWQLTAPEAKKGPLEEEGDPTQIGELVARSDATSSELSYECPAIWDGKTPEVRVGFGTSKRFVSRTMFRASVDASDVGQITHQSHLPKILAGAALIPASLVTVTGVLLLAGAFDKRLPPEPSATMLEFDPMARSRWQNQVDDVLAGNETKGSTGKVLTLVGGATAALATIVIVWDPTMKTDFVIKGP